MSLLRNISVLRHPVAVFIFSLRAAAAYDSKARIERSFSNIHQQGKGRCWYFTAPCLLVALLPQLFVRCYCQTGLETAVSGRQTDGLLQKKTINVVKESPTPGQTGVESQCAKMYCAIRPKNIYLVNRDIKNRLRP
jgi:hypothetical protein